MAFGPGSTRQPCIPNDQLSWLSQSYGFVCGAPCFCQVSHSTLVALAPMFCPSYALELFYFRSYLYFQPADINNIQKERITKFALGSILRLYDKSAAPLRKRIVFVPTGSRVYVHFVGVCVGRRYKRRYMLRQCALELVMEDGQSILFVFNEIEDRDEVHDVIIEQPRLVLLERQQSPLFMNQQLIRWQRGEIDNFECVACTSYLCHFLSTLQYSVWVSKVGFHLTLCLAAAHYLRTPMPPL